MAAPLNPAWAQLGRRHRQPDTLARRRRRYFLAALLGDSLIWLVVILVMLLWPKSFQVESSMIIPNSDPDARVDLKEIGQAYATPRANYDSKSLDPRVNYKEIMLSRNVIDRMAEILKIKPSELVEPRVKLIDQSSIMEIGIKASSARTAMERAQALHRAFHERVDQLRADELAQREKAIERAIESSRDKLMLAQGDLVKFKIKTQIVTDKQLDEMALLSTALERQSYTLTQKLAHLRATVGSLATQLGVPVRLAGWTLTLQGDTVFLEHFKQFATASAQMSDYGHKWDEGHPKVREATGQRDSALQAMLLRARAVVDEPVAVADLRRLALVLQDRSRDQVLRELVTTEAAVQASQAELTEVNRQQRRLAAEMPRFAAESGRLNELQRKVTFTEAVFTGTIGKTDVGHSNPFSSYPLVQTLVAPSLPLKPIAPRLPYVAAGAVLASLFLTVGLGLAWLRHKRELST